jgi:hypothetical protein
MHWVIITPLAPHQQASAIVSRLGGTARDMGRTLTPDEMFNGGIVNGERLDPVTYIVAGLHRNFAQLDEETRLAAMTEFLAFQRRSGESISSVLARYDLVRNRARQEGNFDMNVEGNALQLLRATHTTETQMIEFLRPFNNVLPTTEEQLRTLIDNMRRTYRITEHAPNNLGQHLHGNRQAQPGSYYAETYQGGGQPGTTPSGANHHWQAAPQASPSIFTETSHFFGGMEAPAPSGASAHIPYPYYNNTGSPSYMAVGDGEPELESGTDTDTSSDDPNDPVDFTDLQGYDPQESEEWLYYQKRFHTKRWRRFTQKPVRRVRRFVKRRAYFGRKGKGRSKGKGKRRGSSSSSHQRTLFYMPNQMRKKRH